MATTDAPNTGEGRLHAPRVVVEGATKHFGTHAALDGVSLTIEPGSFVVLLGPSGSGKTTLLRCVAGIERLTAGRIAIGERVVAQGSVHLPPERRDLSMVFQDYALWPHLTVTENVRFALRRRHLPREEGDRRVAAMLARVGLTRLASRYPNELSGGEQQRVALARALAGETGLILFDEPLSNLDANLRELLRVEIATLAREAHATAIYITHDQSEAFALADFIGVLQAGRLVQVGRPEDIYREPATPFVARFTGLAGEIPVDVVDALGAGRAMVRVTGLDGVDPIEARGVNHQVRGAQGSLLVRPAAVRLRPAETPRAVWATIADVAFRGRGYDHAVVLPDGSRLVGIHDEQPHERGAAVALGFDVSGCFYFPSQSAPAQSAASG